MSNSRVIWLSADDPPGAFPSVDNALREPDGLLAAGGDLSVERLLAAYRHGIFPWYSDGQPLLWWSPDPRCVFRKGEFHLSRRLRRELQKSTAEIRFNTAFTDVLHACAGPRRYEQGTWITQDMIAAYGALHRAGWAHSVEIWQEDTLIGGLYGIIIGRVLFGESMFSAQPNSSKIALLVLDRLLESETLALIDCQVQSRHLLSLGASAIPRAQFVDRLNELCEPPRVFDSWPELPVIASQLVQG